MEILFPGLANAPNLHPFFVHAPLVLIPTALLFWLMSLARGSDHLWAVGRWLLALGVVGTIGALATGLIASEGLGHDSPGHGLVHQHRGWMFVATGLALLVSGGDVLTRTSHSKAIRVALVVLLLATTAVISLGGDRGAELVYRFRIGTVEQSVPVETTEEHDHGGHGHGE